MAQIPPPPPPPKPLQLKEQAHQPKNHFMDQDQEHLLPHSLDVGKRSMVESRGTAGEINGREKLKRHRVSVAGRVWVPDMWGQEDLLKDWIDCNAFDAPLVPSKIMMAREALVEEGRRRSSSSFGKLRI